MDKKDKLFLIRLEKVFLIHENFSRLLTNTLVASVMVLMLIITSVIKGMPLSLAIFSFSAFMIIVIIFLLFMAKSSNKRIRREIPELAK